MFRWFGLLLSMLVASSASAQQFGEVVDTARVDAWIAAARAAESRSEAERAASLYLAAAAHDAEMSDFLRFRAVASLLTAERPPLDRLERLGAGLASSGFDGAAQAAVQIEALGGGGLPTPQTFRVAVETDDREAVCTRVGEALVARQAEGLSAPAELVDVHHGWCSDTQVPSLAAAFGVKPSPQARVRRAERLYGQVRFFATVEELDALGDPAAVEDPVLRCRAQFVRGRALYRIRKRRSESEPAYRSVAEGCTSDAVRGLRKKALYALGKRRFDLDDPTGAKPWFEKLLSDFPRTSHADDAIFYLARIARAEKNRPRELELLSLAAAKYSDQDMFGELVWEVHEDLYRTGKHAEFVDAVRAVPGWERDDQYFSQGRLEYFVGRSLEALKRRDEAVESFAAAWDKYPWSFYGYLSRMRLVALGSPPPKVEVELDGVAPWLDEPAWRTRGVGRLDSLGLAEVAAALAAGTAPRDDAERWRMAYVYDRAGRYPVSHNIVRRQIGGRPWVQPIKARLLQWRVAWPDPFGELVEAAVRAEAEQAGRAFVGAALPRAIMREESSFIPDIESYAGALGLMQLMPRTALGHDDDVDGAATPERLADPAVNVRVGVDHLFWLGKRFDGHPVLVAAAYNAGAGAVGKWLSRFGSDDPAMFVEDIPSLQTRDYTKRVIGSYAAYQYLSGGEQFDDRVLRPAKP